MGLSVLHQSRSYDAFLRSVYTPTRNLIYTKRNTKRYTTKCNLKKKRKRDTVKEKERKRESGEREIEREKRETNLLYNQSYESCDKLWGYLYYTKAVRMTHSYEAFIRQTRNLVYTKRHTKRYTTKCNLN